MEKTKAAVTLVCDDCPPENRAEVAVDAIKKDVHKTTPDGRISVQSFPMLLLPEGWEIAEVEPPSVVVRSSPENFQVFSTSPEEIARLTATKQPVHRCPACRVKARDRAVVKSVGAKVVDLHGRPL